MTRVRASAERHAVVLNLMPSAFVAIRLIMKLISKRIGRPTDASRSYEFTDWDTVDRFGGELAVGFRELAPLG